MDEKLDPELEQLMNELEKVEEQVKPDSNKSELEAKQEEVRQEEVKQEEIKKEEVKKGEDKQEEAKKETEVKVVETVNIDEFEEKKVQMQKRLIGLVDMHCDSAARIIQDVESDREKCNDVYNILIAKLQNNDYRASDVAAIVATLQTKADITKTRADMMDSVAKLLASLKNNNTVPTDGAGGGDISQDEVKRLLS